MQTGRIRLTYEDYALLPEDGRRHEIIDGDEVVSPSPNTRHQRLVFRLARLLDAHVRRHGLGEVFVAPYDVLLSEHDIVQPDVLSESTRRTDLLRKRRLYERAGVAEYWAVDPAIDQVQAFRPRGGVYERAAELSREAGDTLATPLLPGLAIPLAELFGGSRTA